MSIAYYDRIPRDHATTWHRKEDSPGMMDAATFGIHFNEGITDRQSTPMPRFHSRGTKCIDIFQGCKTSIIVDSHNISELIFPDSFHFQVSRTTAMPLQTAHFGYNKQS
jgi:hypothetical protein